MDGPRCPGRGTAGRASRQAQGSVSIVTASDGAIVVPGWPEHDGPEHGRAARARSAWPPDPGVRIAAAGHECGQEGHWGVSGGPGNGHAAQLARAAPGGGETARQSAMLRPAVLTASPWWKTSSRPRIAKRSRK